MFKSYYKIILINLIVFFIFGEILSTFLILSKIVPDRSPSYNIQNVFKILHIKHEKFGIYRRENFTYKRDIFSKKIKTNNIGGLDKNHKKKKSTIRGIIIGDSYIEGDGLPNRASSLIEDVLNIEMINLSHSSYGSTLYHLLYDEFGSQYEHDFVVIGLYSNDLVNDDIQFRKKYYSKNYKPVYEGNYPDFKLTYLDNDFVNKPSMFFIIKGLFREFTFSYTAFKYLTTKALINLRFKQEQKKLTVKEKEESLVRGSFYFNYTARQLDILKYNLEKIKLISGKKPVILVSLGTTVDIEYFLNKNNSSIVNELSRICEKLEIEYYDSLAYFAKIENYKSLYDETYHWNAEGEKYFMEFLIPILKKVINKECDSNIKI